MELCLGRSCCALVLALELQLLHQDVFGEVSIQTVLLLVCFFTLSVLCKSRNERHRAYILMKVCCWFVECISNTIMLDWGGGWGCHWQVS